MFDSSDAYIVVKDLLAAATNKTDEAENNFALKNDVSYIQRRCRRSWYSHVDV